MIEPTHASLLTRVLAGAQLNAHELASLGSLGPPAKALMALPPGQRPLKAYDLLLAAGLSADDIAALTGVAANRPKWLPDSPRLSPVHGATLFDKQIEPLAFLVEGLIARGYCALLAGRPKSGKSWLGLQLAEALDTGAAFLGRTTSAARVLYCALEDGERRIRQRLHQRHWRPAQAHFVYGALQPFDGAGEGIDQLMRAADAFDLVVVDTLIATLTSRTDERDNTSMAAIMNRIATWAHEREKAIVVVHHTRKGESEDPFEMIRGAGAIRGAYDVGLVLQRKPKEAEAVLSIECRDFDAFDMTVKFDAAQGWSYEGAGEQIQRIRAGRAVVRALGSLGDGATTTQIAEHLRITPQAAREQLNLAERQGLVRHERDEAAKGKAPFRWFLATSAEQGA